MKLTTSLFVLGLGAAAPAYAAERAHESDVMSLGYVGQIVSKAEEICPGLKADQDKLEIGIRIAGMDFHNPVDTVIFTKGVQQSMNDIENDIKHWGREEWCRGAKALYGPTGEKIPGLLKQSK